MRSETEVREAIRKMENISQQGNRNASIYADICLTVLQWIVDEEDQDLEFGDRRFSTVLKAGKDSIEECTFPGTFIN
jgi:Fic family protein